MAVRSKKDTLIEDAQKLALRGQFDKAAKVYEQVLALDPTAINLRQKMAELLIKCGENEAARKELETIGKHFSKNGFYLKAIAVYKQLQKLFPADISLSMMLAELNEKHGLAANAISEYKLVYGFHEKAGNIPEALNILDRMQNVDPQNIPIKIKLAEALAQNGKKDESYAVFARTASLLLERGDIGTLSRICDRIQLFFPNRPDFMLELLTEQLSENNAATAVNCLQGLLRSNQSDKRLWDLIVRAYQLLDQPERVKIAYQHYLKFFPAEPAAILGLISAVTAEQNLAGSLELLDQYEVPLISAGYLQQLKQVYQALDKMDPINTRVLEGFIRVASAAKNESEVRSLTSKLNSLRSVSGGVPNAITEPELPTVFSEMPSLGATHPEDFNFLDVGLSEQTIKPFSGADETATATKTASDAEHANAVIDRLYQHEEEIEIDVDFDIDAPVGSPEQETMTTPVQDNWLDSVDDLFNTIDTAPRLVKFGNEMESTDAQSHFDLGQAFKEMGLYDEAINEFRQASQDASRRVECLIMQCACLRERGELEKAITMLLALLKPGLSEEECCAVKYELASDYEAAGKKEEASILLNEINATKPGFRDIGARINAADSSESLDFSDEDLDDFGLK